MRKALPLKEWQVLTRALRWRPNESLSNPSASIHALDLDQIDTHQCNRANIDTQCHYSLLVDTTPSVDIKKSQFKALVLAAATPNLPWSLKGDRLPWAANCPPLGMAIPEQD